MTVCYKTKQERCRQNSVVWKFVVKITWVRRVAVIKSQWPNFGSKSMICVRQKYVFPEIKTTTKKDFFAVQSETLFSTNDKNFAQKVGLSARSRTLSVSYHQPNLLTNFIKLKRLLLLLCGLYIFAYYTAWAGNIFMFRFKFWCGLILGFSMAQALFLQLHFGVLAHIRVAHFGKIKIINLPGHFPIDFTKLFLKWPNFSPKNIFQTAC